MNTNSPLLILPSPAQPTNAAAGLDIRGLKAPVEIPDPWLWLWWTLGALALVVLLFTLWKRRQNQLQQARPEILIPPHERARQKLAEALGWLHQPRPFCILVSDTIRLYLEERFRFHAPERTTEEFLYELQASDLLTPDQKQSLGDFLGRCDLVKFARYEPGEPELKDLYDAACRLVDETGPALAAPQSSTLDPVKA
jgi:hypothetical protein